MSIYKNELTSINDTINREIEVVPIKTLTSFTFDRAYVNEAMSIKKFGKAILVTLEAKTKKVTFKTWLSKRITDQFKVYPVSGIH